MTGINGQLDHDVMNKLHNIGHERMALTLWELMSEFRMT